MRPSAGRAAGRTFGQTPSLALDPDRRSEAGAGAGRRRLSGAFRIRLDRIEADPDQPRKTFDEAKLGELTASVRRFGVLQPVLVRYDAEADVYRTVAGARRVEASRRAGLEDVPAWVREPADDEVLVQQVVENWQREDLGPFELADALARLRDGEAWSQARIARETGRSESEVSRLLGLLKLVPEVQRVARDHPGVPRRRLYALSRLSPDRQAELADTLLTDDDLTVEQAERAVRRKSPGRPRGTAGYRRTFATGEATVRVQFRRSGGVEDAEVVAALREAVRLAEAGEG